jgi:hypothetical protein
LSQSRCDPIFLLRPAHHDPERIIRQRPLQRLGLIPRRASRHRALWNWSLLRLPARACSLFIPALDGPSHDYLTPPHLQFIDWPVAQTWRKALIEASGITARVPSA